MNNGVWRKTSLFHVDNLHTIAMSKEEIKYVHKGSLMILEVVANVLNQKQAVYRVVPSTIAMASATVSRNASAPKRSMTPAFLNIAYGPLRR